MTIENQNTGTNKSKKRALVVGLGAFYGAYDAGVLATLCRNLGPDYFDTVYACSVGVCAATFYAANQPDTIERTWRHLVDGRKIMNFLHPFRGKEAANIAKLVELFRGSESRLDTENAFSPGKKVIYALTSYPSGEPCYQKATKENWHQLMRASTALPLLNKPVMVDNKRFIDGGLADPLPIEKAFADGYDEIIVVLNKERGTSVRRFHVFSVFFNILMPRAIGKLLRNYGKRARAIEDILAASPRIRVIRPDKHLPLRHLFDTNKRRLNAAIDQGIEDAKEFLRMTR